MTLLSIGDEVEPGVYELHSRFQRAVSFIRGQRLVFVVDEQIGAGPRNIAVGNLNSDGAPALFRLRIGRNEVIFASQRLGFTDRDRYRSDFVLRGWSWERFRQNLELFGELLSAVSAASSLAFLLDPKRRRNFRTGFTRRFAARITRGVDQVLGGDLRRGIEALKGCGLGLTPSGDDFIAGLLIGLNLLQQMRQEDFRNTIDAVFRNAVGQNVFSNTFLDLARRGRLFEPMKNLILALTREEPDAVRTATQKLLAMGETSGADLGTGFFLTLRNECGAVAPWSDEGNAPVLAFPCALAGKVGAA